MSSPGPRECRNPASKTQHIDGKPHAFAVASKWQLQMQRFGSTDDWRDTGVMVGTTSSLGAGDAEATALDHVGQARALLRGHGLRCTAPRLAVLTVVVTDPAAGHLTIAELHHRLLADGVEVDLTTVYRTVSTLVDLGVLHALTVDERATSFGLAAEPHHHAVCTRCGTVIEIPAKQLSTALAHASAGSAFILSDCAGLTLHGLCPNCQGDPAGN
jgi:Fur family ferric uptake transcriptional regulator